MKKIVLVASLGLVGLVVQASEPVGSSTVENKQTAGAPLNEASVVEASSPVSTKDEIGENSFDGELDSDGSLEDQSLTTLNQSVATTEVSGAELVGSEDEDNQVNSEEEVDSGYISQNLLTNTVGASLVISDNESESASSEENIVPYSTNVEEPKGDDLDKGVSFKDRFVSKQAIYSLVGAACLIAFYLYRTQGSSEKIVRV